MWICDDCGAVFEEPGSYREIHTELDDMPVEMVSCCPECGGGFWTEAKMCPRCEEYYSVDDLIGGKLCKGCLDEIIKMNSDVVRKYIDADRDAFAEFAAEELNL